MLEFKREYVGNNTLFYNNFLRDINTFYYNSMEANLTVEIVQSNWLEEILADPISKTTLKKNSDIYYSENGFSYKIKNRVPDFRIRLNQFDNEWQKGQDVYEQWMLKYLNNAENDNNYYPEEQKRDAPMYQKLVLEGRVLDVGGSLGYIRKYMTENQEYCSVDPFIDLHKLAEGKKNLFKNYLSDQQLNFVAGYAEFLPFGTSTFQTVNMRSCIDHFCNPELSLLEANRVLKENGKLIIGMTVKVNSTKNIIKEAARKILNLFTKKFQDKHIWHPSRNELITMCSKCGFDLEDEIWQNENVWYASFRKNSTDLLQIT